jgi:AAA+ ATPase superfamily predicted ATPase
VLSDPDIVEREVPVTEDKPVKSKKGVYRINDEFFKFWSRFVFSRRAELKMDNIQENAKIGVAGKQGFEPRFHDPESCVLLVLRL